MPPNNTTSRITWYIISTLTAMLLSFVGAYAYSNREDVRDLQSRMTQVERHYSEINAKLDFLIKNYGRSR